MKNPLLQPFRSLRLHLGAVGRWLGSDTSAAVLLIAVAVFALAWANSPFADSYHTLWHFQLQPWPSVAVSVHATMNDGLMTLFFLLLALLAGIGFTMSIFMAGLSFTDPGWLAVAKLAVLAGSTLAALGGLLWGRLMINAGKERPTLSSCPTGERQGTFSRWRHGPGVFPREGMPRRHPGQGISGFGRLS